MTNATHTPGPWHINEELSKRATYLVFSGDGNGYLVANVGNYHTDDKECEANARLIAAAPDLLEALRFIADDIAEGVKAKGSWERLARAAIAKATGGVQ
jgi:hypothetical protein